MYLAKYFINKDVDWKGLDSKSHMYEYALWTHFVSSGQLFFTTVTEALWELSNNSTKLNEHLLSTLNTNSYVVLTKQKARHMYVLY